MRKLIILLALSSSIFAGSSNLYLKRSEKLYQKKMQERSYDREVEKRADRSKTFSHEEISLDHLSRKAPGDGKTPFENRLIQIDLEYDLKRTDLFERSTERGHSKEEVEKWEEALQKERYGKMLSATEIALPEDDDLIRALQKMG